VPLQVQWIKHALHVDRNQAERGHGPIIVLVMARVRQNGKSSLINSVIRVNCLHVERMHQAVGGWAGGTKDKEYMHPSPPVQNAPKRISNVGTHQPCELVQTVP